MKFSQVLKLNAPELVVSRRHEAWMSRNLHPTYSPRALEFARHQLTNKGRVRTGTFSASSLGGCARQQQFEFQGMPQLPWDAKGTMKVQNGAFMHLRWQMEGLTEGWLSAAEVPVPNVFGLRGTMDGILYEGSVLELKSINERGFSALSTFGPNKEHLFQMATYLLCTKRERGVFIYENKNTQEYTEIVRTKDELPIEEAASRAEELWAKTQADQMYEPLNDCIDRKGWRYESCPYRGICLNTHGVGETG